MVADPALPPVDPFGVRAADPGGPDPTGLPDDLVDALGRSFRRLRHGMVKPPLATIPIPSLGRPVDIAKVFACDVVAELTGSGGQATVKDVAAALELEQSTVSRLLGEAEADGLVVRGGDPADRRRTTVSLTFLGRQVVADSVAIRRSLLRAVLADWDRADIETLARLMTRLADTIAGRLDTLAEDTMQELASRLEADASGRPSLRPPDGPTR